MEEDIDWMSKEILLIIMEELKLLRPIQLKMVIYLNFSTIMEEDLILLIVWVKLTKIKMETFNHKQIKMGSSLIIKEIELIQEDI